MMYVLHDKQLYMLTNTTWYRNLQEQTKAHQALVEERPITQIFREYVAKEVRDIVEEEEWEALHELHEDLQEKGQAGLIDSSIATFPKWQQRKIKNYLEDFTCPMCNGEKGFVEDVYEPVFGHNQYTIPCSACEATGKLNNNDNQ